MSSIKDEALRLLAAGLSVIPIRADGSKAPALKAWKPEQKRPMSAATAAELFTGKVGLAVISGAVSGNLECLDFETMAVFSRWCERVPALLRDQLVMVATAGGGMHLRYRCEEPIPAGRKLARAADCELLIETRGEGHYALVPPSPAACHPSGNCYELVQGDLAALPRLTADQRESLIQAAQALNEYVDTPARVESPLKRSAPLWEDDLPPGEDYNRRGDWPALLTRHGWRLDKCVGETQHWTRAGKDDGTSATLGHVAPGIFVVFSTNAAPFEAEKGYDLFGAYARLEHGGDFAAAGRALRAEGYGAAPAETVTIKVGKKKARLDAEGEPEEATEADEEPQITKLKDDTMAQKWAEKKKKVFMFVDGGQWWRWQQSHWRYCGSDIAETEAIKFLRGLRKTFPDIDVTPTRAANILSLSRADLGPVLQDELNPRKDWIPLRNGIFDVEKGTSAPHAAAHRNTYCLDYPYDQAATCPRWTQFLGEVLIDREGLPCAEWIGAVQEWFGYCLIADPNRAQAAMVWVGEGGNGKGVATRVLEKLVGAGQHLAIAVEQLHEPYHRAALVGKLVGFVNEPSRRALEKNGDTVKAITGGDLISARNPGEKVFSFRPTTRLLVSCNDLPSTKDLSRGYFRRLVLIEWRYNVPNPDTGLDGTLEAELPGIFNWAVEGLKRFQGRGYRFADLPESDTLKADYRKSQDVAEQFVDDACMTGAGNASSATLLYSSFRAWLQEAGHKDVMDKRRFGMRIAAILKARGLLGKSKPKRDGAEFYREWEGIALRPERQEVEIGPSSYSLL